MIVRCMDRIHKIHVVERKATRRIYMGRGFTYEETNNLSSRQCKARYVEEYVWCIEKKAKRWAIEKPKLDNARLVPLKERPPEGFSWSGERLKRKQTTSRPDNVWLEPN